MGRRKGQIAMMGQSLLVRDKHKRQPGQRRNEDSFLHTTDLDDGTTYNRINFQSVTEQSNLEDFLTTAEMAGKDFTAERQNIQIITNPGQGKRLTAADMQEISKAQNTHKALLKIPRRPHWDERTTKEELLLLERDTFTDWRRQLKMLEEKEHILLTPYEKNLDFWRQLWRVIERSDVVVQIVDARNPLLFRCEDLETYVKEVDSNKACMLLINKADYLTRQQRQAWVEFFNKNGITAVFFSAMDEKEKMENSNNPTIAEEEEQDAGASKDSNSETESDDDEKDNDSAECEHEAEREDEDERDDEQEEQASNLKNETEPNVIVNEDLCARISGSVNVEDGPSKETDTVSSNKNSSSLPHPSSENVVSETVNVSQETASSSSHSVFENNTNIVSAEELLDVFRKLSHRAVSARMGSNSSQTVRTVGMVGYPNVGKSSTINVILKQKKLAVSATPGRTKHLQTLYVDDNLMLCDCPGLVFPSFVATKAHLVINGILPIDELRDHVAPTNLICDRIPRAVLETTYSIMIPRPSMDDNSDRPPTSEELLFAYGGMRGFMTPRGVPDAPRASRYILKDYVKGKLLYCEAPPGLDGSKFQDKDRINILAQHRPQSKVPPPQIMSSIDREFFAKREGLAHSRGKLGVADHVRVDTLQPSARVSESSAGIGAGASGSSIGGSQSSLASSSMAGMGKPWKRHNNRNKKEKLRRLHRDLDIH